MLTNFGIETKHINIRLVQKFSKGGGGIKKQSLRDFPPILSKLSFSSRCIVLKFIAGANYTIQYFK